MADINDAPQESARRSSLPLAKLLLCILIALGIFFRFYNLDRKIFWHDEALTSLAFSGYTHAQAYIQIQGKITSFKDLGQYQRLNPERGLKYVLEHLTHSQPEHAPAFYLIGYYWCKIFGSDVTAVRTFPALISLLQLPCIYWLAMELFATPFAAGLATALMALSPLQVLYAQELREYSLYTVLVLLLSSIFLKTLRKPSFSGWALYFFALVIASYSSTLTITVVLAHFLYLLAIYGFKWNKTYLSFFVVCALAFICFLPWLFQVLRHFTTATGPARWMAVSIPLSDLVNGWFDNVGKAFVDLGSDYKRLSNGLSSVILVIVTYALYLVCLCKRPQARLILTFLAAVIVVFILPDLLLGGQRSIYIKYMMPLPIAVLLAVAYMLSLRLNTTFRQTNKFWLSLASFVFACEVASCLVESQAANWYTKAIKHQDLPRVALFLNHDPHALIVIERGEQMWQTNLPQMLALSHLVKSDARLELLDEPRIPYVPPDTDHFYLFNPSQYFLHLLTSHNFPLSPVDKLEYFWVVATANPSPHAGHNRVTPAEHR